MTRVTTRQRDRDLDTRRRDPVSAAPYVECDTSQNEGSLGAPGELSSPPIGHVVFDILTRGDDLSPDMAQVNLP